MSNLPEVCNLCEHADVADTCRPICTHPEREKQGIVLANPPPSWCPLRGEAKPAKPDGFRILISPDGQVRKVMFGDTDVSGFICGAKVSPSSSRVACNATITLAIFTLEIIDD